LTGKSHGCQPVVIAVQRNWLFCLGNKDENTIKQMFFVALWKTRIPTIDFQELKVMTIQYPKPVRKDATQEMLTDAGKGRSPPVLRKPGKKYSPTKQRLRGRQGSRASQSLADNEHEQTTDGLPYKGSCTYQYIVEVELPDEIAGCMIFSAEKCHGRTDRFCRTGGLGF
jgi:hypothetical protein